jgi:protein-tyrosine phosphatase
VQYVRVDRWVALDGCDNFRDIGGYTTRDGRATRWATLYRSDTLARVTDEVMSRAQRDLSIRTVIDLRTTDEVERLGSPAWLSEAGVQSIAVPMANPEIEALRRAGADGMGELYLWNLDVKQEGFGRIVRLLADFERLPCVIQCNAGKDRTGIVIALLLELLAVPDETIVEDYLLTDEVASRTPQQQYEEAVATLLASGLDPAILRTHRRTIVRFLEGFRERWRSVEDYVKGAGVTDSDVATFRHNLLMAGDQRQS